MKINRLLLVVAIVAATERPVDGIRTQPTSDEPQDQKLLVIVAIDQMRGDYIDKYQHQWTAGLKRLVTGGAWFRQADYPYFNTITCAGHASISTGTLPVIHGMILNKWWDRAAGRVVECTEDPAERPISYGDPVTTAGQSAARLLTTTLPDELRLQHIPVPRVVSVSLKARSAIGLAGHHPDVVTWMDDSGQWVTSTAFAKGPVPFIADYVRAHPLRQYMGRAWDRALGKESYVHDDSPVGRTNAAPSGSLNFPHPMKGRTEMVDASFAKAWEASPFADAYVAGLATAAIDALKLGQGNSIDYLGISFSALDKVGHRFGPESHEVQDILIRLDRELGTLLDTLDRLVGRDRYTLALSADHGVSPLPERLQALGYDAGRIDLGPLGVAIDAAISKHFGEGTYVARVLHTDIYFLPGVYQRLVEYPDAMDSVLQTIRRTPGVWRVYRKEEVRARVRDADPTTQAVAGSYYEGRSGDLVMLPRAYWVTREDSDSATSHGTGHRYDTRVPVLLYGRGIRPGQYLEPASPLDIAPTLAFLTSVTLPDPMGRVLTEALDPGAARRPTVPSSAPVAPARR